MAFVKRVAFGLIGLVALGSAAHAQEKATLRLDWSVGPWQAPFFLAEEKGYYKAEGIDLEILEGKGSLTTMQLVGRGNDTFGYVDAAGLPKSVAAGIPIKMVQGIYKKNMMAIVVRQDANVNSVADLKGKTITITAGDAQSNLMPAYLSANKLPNDTFKMMAVDGGAKYRLVATGEAHGVGSFGAIGIGILESINSGVQYKAFDFADAGITVPGFGVIASNDTIKKNPKLVAAFVRATAKGWEDARKDPNAAVEAAFKKFPQARSRDAEFRKVLTLLNAYIDTPNTVGKPFGWMSPQDWAVAEKLLVQYADLKAQSSVDAYFTNEFAK